MEISEVGFAGLMGLGCWIGGIRDFSGGIGILKARVGVKKESVYILTDFY